MSFCHCTHCDDAVMLVTMPNGPQLIVERDGALVGTASALLGMVAVPQPGFVPLHGTARPLVVSQYHRLADLGGCTFHRLHVCAHHPAVAGLRQNLEQIEAA